MTDYHKVISNPVYVQKRK